MRVDHPFQFWESENVAKELEPDNGSDDQKRSDEIDREIRHLEFDNDQLDKRWEHLDPMGVKVEERGIANQMERNSRRIESLKSEKNALQKRLADKKPAADQGSATADGSK